MSTILWLFGIWSKLERWKSLISGCLMKWLQIKKKKKSSFWSITFSYFIQQWTISWLDCDMWQKVDFMWQPVITKLLDQEGAPKHFPSRTRTRKRSWSLFCGLLPLRSTTALWILAKPLHRRSMLSKSIRCTEICNTCSRHRSKERAQFSMTVTDHMWHSQRFKSWTNGAMKFLLICHNHLTSHQLISLFQASQ